MRQDQETLFVFVTAQGRVMARLSDGTIADVTDYCDLLPRHVCCDESVNCDAPVAPHPHARTRALAA